MNSVASSAVLGLVAVPPMADATSNNKERHVDRAVCQREERLRSGKRVRRSVGDAGRGPGARAAAGDGGALQRLSRG